MEGYNFNAKRPVETYHKSDILFFISVVFLWGLGLFTLSCCSQHYGLSMFGDPFHFVKRQLIYSAIGAVAFALFMFMNMNFIRRMLPLMVFATALLCAGTFVPGIRVELNGASRWIKMPFSFLFQPSELVKFTLVLYFANFFRKWHETELEEDKSVLPCVGLFIFFLVLIFAQQDLSTPLFIACIGILMFFVSGTKIVWIFPVLLLAVPAGVLMISLNEYRLKRIIGFIKPEENLSTINYQSIASRRAISAGGIWGDGIGIGLDRLRNIPEIQSDYIFAGWVEAMGFVGFLVYIAALLFFAWRGYRTAMRCPDRFSAYASFGCVSVIFFQSLMNIMVVGGLLPATGIPLPFFSQGGSSMIVTLAMCGFVLNASRCEENNESYSKDVEINIDTFGM